MVSVRLYEVSHANLVQVEKNQQMENVEIVQQESTAMYLNHNTICLVTHVKMEKVQVPGQHFA
tara:strand:+ start:270 stop:458 length:189 start_codon:yes stop_codon:yes gene_type:complete